ncbi:hypothetical protein ABPG74_017319 [Tetrahymena malaccensis]
MIGNKYSSVFEGKLQENLSLRNVKDGWKEVKKGKDVVLYTTKYQNFDVKLAKIEATAAVNIEKASAYYFDNLDGQKQCRDMCDKLIKLETVDQDTVVTLFKTKSKFLVSSREVVGVQHRRKINENEYLITRDCIEEHPNAPKSKDVVRAEGKFYAIFLTKINENTTKFEMYMLLDPKGNIPTSVVNSLIEEQHETVIKDIEMIKKM